MRVRLQGGRAGVLTRRGGRLELTVDGEAVSPAEAGEIELPAPARGTVALVDDARRKGYRFARAPCPRQPDRTGGRGRSRSPARVAASRTNGARGFPIWTDEENAIVLGGGVPEGRTPGATYRQRSKLRKLGLDT